MKFATLLVSLGMAAALVVGPAEGRSFAQQKKASAGQQVPTDQLPQAITSAVQKTYPGSSIVTAYKVTRGTEVRYRLSVKTASTSQPLVLTATPDGILRTGKGKGREAPTANSSSITSGTSAPASSPGDPIGIDQLPKAVTKAIKDAYPKNSIVQAFKVTGGSDVSYEVVLTDIASLQPMRVLVGADGKIQRR